jgi:dipeptidyl aminopeptidase/acylaminoacyl peptidase
MRVTAPVFTPSVAPVAFMLGGPHKVGRTQTMSVFDPTTRTVLRHELRIHAESLFTVVDSAARGSTGDWAVANRDTVRAWQIGGAPGGLTAWVDAEGRVVAAKLSNGLSVTRTAFEIAYRTSKKR